MQPCTSTRRPNLSPVFAVSRMCALKIAIGESLAGLLCPRKRTNNGQSRYVRFVPLADIAVRLRRPEGWPSREKRNDVGVARLTVALFGPVFQAVDQVCFRPFGDALDG